MKSKLVKVKMLVNTAYQGPRKEGDVIFVPEDFANRWVKNGIAELVCDDVSGNNDVTNDANDSNEPEGTGDVTEGNKDDSVVDYTSMSAKDLFAACKEKGIDVEAKKSKEYYIEKLTSN